MSAHTKGEIVADGSRLLPKRGGVMAEVRSDEDAARLSLCWNMHDELVSLLTAMRNECSGRPRERMLAPLLKQTDALLSRIQQGGRDDA